MSNEETLYARFLSGELTRQEVEQLKKNGDWEKLEKISKATSGLSLPAFDKTKGFEKLAAARQKNVKSKSLVQMYGKYISAIAASLLILIGYLMLFQNHVTLIEAPFATQENHQFEDQSEVIVNAGSSISYNSNSWEKARDISIDGEAYFKVTKGAPFIVKSSVGQVEVLGTEFNVRTRDDFLEVLCYEGRVSVTYPSGTTTLNPQEGISIRNGKVTKKEVSTNQPEWMDGLSRFINEPLEEVFREMERQYNVQIIGDIKGGFFTGIFTHDNLKQATNQISSPYGLNVDISDDQKVITFSK